MHDRVFCDVGPIVHKHESIKGGQKSCSLRTISIECVRVNTFKSTCFIFFVVLGEIFEGEGIISSASRSARRFVAGCLRWSHSKQSKDIFVLWFVVFFIFIAGRVIEWHQRSFFLFPLNYLCCSFHGCFEWCCLRLRWSFSVRRWSGRFSTLFKWNEVYAWKWVVFKS